MHRLQVLYKSKSVFLVASVLVLAACNGRALMAMSPTVRSPSSYTDTTMGSDIDVYWGTHCVIGGAIGGGVGRMARHALRAS